MSSHSYHALASLVGAATLSHQMSKSSVDTAVSPLDLTSIQVVTNDARFSLQGAADRSEQVWRAQCIVISMQDHMHGCMHADQGNVDVTAAPWVRVQQPRIPD